MSVYKPKDGRTWRYSFYWRKQRYTSSTDLNNKRATKRWEEKYRQDLELEAAGLQPPTPTESPRFAIWAGVCYAHTCKVVTRPDRIDDLLRVLLRFLGPRPKGTIRSIRRSPASRITTCASAT